MARTSGQRRKAAWAEMSFRSRFMTLTSNERVMASRMRVTKAKIRTSRRR